MSTLHLCVSETLACRASTYSMLGTSASSGLRFRFREDAQTSNPQPRKLEALPGPPEHVEKCRSKPSTTHPPSVDKRNDRAVEDV